MQPVIVLPMRVRTLVCDDQSTVHTQLFAPLACCRVLRVCATVNIVLHCISVWFFMPLCWISRCESSGYTFATTGQMYDEL